MLLPNSFEDRRGSAVKFSSVIIFYPTPPLIISTLCSLHTMQTDDTPCLSTLELKMTLVALGIKNPKIRSNEKIEVIISLFYYICWPTNLYLSDYRTLLISFGTTKPAFTSFSVLNGLSIPRPIP